MSLFDNVSLPAPKWFRITKKLVSNTFNFAIVILLLCGYKDSSLVMLIIKVSQSFVADQLDTFMSNGEVYAPNPNVPTANPEVNVTNKAS